MKGANNTLFPDVEKQVLKIAIYGDSILASGFSDSLYGDNDPLECEQPPRNCKYESIQRMIYEFLGYNCPVFRGASHRSWKYEGNWHQVDSQAEPLGTRPDDTRHEGRRLRNETLMGMEEGEEGVARIVINGCETAVFLFESGVAGEPEETGGVCIEVFVDGQKWNDLSTPSFFDTSFTSPNIPGECNRHAPMMERVYTRLDPRKTYNFHVVKAAAEKKVKLWGCYCFNGQTLIVHNECKPGLSWNQLFETAYSDLKLSETDIVILQAPMYHDKVLEQAGQDARRLIGLLKSWGMKVVLCSCPPAGITPTGMKATIPGNQASVYYAPGENVYSTFTYRRVMKTHELATPEDCPGKDAVYEVRWEGQTYELVCCDTINHVTLDQTAFIVPRHFPELKFPIVFTKKSGVGKQTITYTSMKPHFTMESHAALMRHIALEMECPFIDLFQAFVNVALLAGERLDHPGYAMAVDDPLFHECLVRERDAENYPGLRQPFLMNVMTQYFDLEDSHHLAYPAHEVIFMALRPLLEQIKCRVNTRQGAGGGFL